MVRVWSAHHGFCLALLQGHTSLVCQLQLSPTTLVTGGSDGRVMVFNLANYSLVHRIAAHDSSVSAVQFSDVGGSDASVSGYDCPSPLLPSRIQALQSPLVNPDQPSTSTSVLGLGITGMAGIAGINIPDTIFPPSPPTASSSSLPPSSPSLSLTHPRASGLASGFLVTSGNDGRAILFDVVTGSRIRELADRSEEVWKVMFCDDRLVVVCKRLGVPVVEFWGFRPNDDEV